MVQSQSNPRIAPTFLAAALLVALLWPFAAGVLRLYLAASLICFVAYAVDKSAAIAGRHRIAESTLLLLGLVGGWPGAILAQRTLRHKSSKASFRRAHWGTVLLNLAGLIAWHSAWLPPLGR